MQTPFHKGHEKARKRYRTQHSADYWLDLLDTTRLNLEMIKLIENIEYFFISTASLEGAPNLNFKGGNRGILHVVDDRRLVFPELAGNGILHSLGDLEENDKVSLLVIDFNQQARLKISGRATVLYEDLYIHPYSAYFQGYDFHSLIVIDIDYVIPNCPKYISKVRESILDFDPKSRDAKIIQKLCGLS